MSNTAWLDHEVGQMLSAYQAGVLIQDIADQIGRTPRAVRAKLCALRVLGDNRALREKAPPATSVAPVAGAWSDDDKQFVLLAKREGKTAAEMAAALGRSVNSVKGVIDEMRDEGLLLPNPKPQIVIPAMLSDAQERMILSIMQRLNLSRERAIVEMRAHYSAKARRHAA
ncbi:hypothetical protein EOD42_23315 [Rhodovarius crocodyli]|uniref:Uncharacterized protein n=1 Tax=Rhodovarius crocodyli TaxID=1979269 RepID=A0A437LZP6_9PROT|nr:hypothetical protein [Rhodovarius crocodyli]RVT90734.1 hypothetical protein EOD42_23315 [Rhodovarius crocodyli]